MAQGQQLDTSGVVLLPESDGYGAPMMRVGWEGLSPFEQGFIRAILNEANHEKQRGRRNPLPLGSLLGFSDLAPEALDMILRDCEAELAAIHPTIRECFGASAAMGASFFRIRQRGEQTHSRAEPLRITLTEAGKVWLEVANA